MRPAGIQVAGAASKPPLPQYGILHNVMLADKWRGLFPSAIAPFGTIALSAASDSYVLASATSPAMVVPGRPFSKGGKEAHSTENIGVDDFGKLLESTYAPLYEQLLKAVTYESLAAVRRDWLSIPAERVGNGVIHTSNGRSSDTIMKHHTFHMLLATMQKGLMYIKPPSTVKLEAIGMGIVGRDGEDIIVPGETVKFGSHVMKLDYPSQPQTIRQLKETFRYHGWVTYCLTRLLKACPEGHLWSKGRLGLLDLHAYVAYMLCSYGGVGKSAPDTIVYSVDDVLSNVLTFLGLPYSQAYPYVAPDEKLGSQFYIVELLFKMALGLSVQRVGGTVVPVQYTWVAGAAAIVRDALPHYIRPTLKLGGGNNLWLQPAIIRDVVDGIYMPMAIRPAQRCVWERRSTWSETFKDTTVDRGELTRGEEDVSENLRLVVSRDARIYTLRDRLDRYVVVNCPVGFSGMAADSWGTAYLISYLTDAVQAPESACFVTPASFMALDAFVAVEQVGLVAPIPSGVNPVDGTEALIATAQTAATPPQEETVKDSAGRDIADPSKKK